MAQILQITVILTVVIVLAVTQDNVDPMGTCDSMGGSSCSANRKEELRFIMVGMTGTGKSATGNMIAGLVQKARDMAYAAWNNIKPFLSLTSSKSVTSEGKRVDVTLYGRKVAIVDTPGFFDTRVSVETTIEQILKCTYLIAPGPHAILLVARADRLTDEVLNALELMKKVFGNELVKHLVVVFTYADNLKRDGETIEHFVERLEGPYKQLLQQAENRYVSFDNTLDPSSPDNEQQVRRLLEMTDKIVDRNHGKCYRNELLEESHILMKEEEKKQARKLEEKQKELEELKRKAQQNEMFKAELKRYQDEIERLQRVNKDLEARVNAVLNAKPGTRHKKKMLDRLSKVFGIVSGVVKCFASTSTVNVQGSNGEVTRQTLQDLEVGDLVESYDPDTNSVVFSPVYYIIYKDDNESVSVLRRLFYEDFDGRVHSLSLQPKHMVYANAPCSVAHSPYYPPPIPKMSEDVKIGDILWIKNASGKLNPKPVVKIDEVLAHVRHPLSFNHYIIVDGVLASVHAHNEWLSRQVTAPLRLLYNISPSIGDVWVTKKMVHSWDWVERNLLE